MNQSEPAKQNEDLVIPNQPNILNGVVLEAISGLFKTTTAVPTGQAQKLSEQVRIYDGKIYVYDDTNDVWLSSSGGNYLVGSTVRTSGSTGTQAVTVGFKPKMIRITACRFGKNYPSSVGVATHDGTTTTVRIHQHYYNVNGYIDYIGADGNVVNLPDNTGDNYGTASIASFDASGFTLNWTQINFDVSFMWEAYG